jgi:WD40 repeat protein
MTNNASGEIKIWKTSSGKLYKKFKLPRATVSAAEFSPNGKYLVTGLSREELILWNIKLNCINHMQSDPSEMNQIIDRVASINKHRSNLFKKELSDIVGIIDMVDVTLAYKNLYELQ